MPDNYAPYYRKHVFCCINERAPGHPRGCCKEKGSIELRGYLKSRAKDLGLDDIRINNSGCLDRCELGPTVVIYPEAVWYTCQSKMDVEEILRVHLLEGGIVERLRLHPEQEDLRPEQQAQAAE